MNKDRQSLLRTEVFRQSIAAFIDERREAKLKGQSDDEAGPASAKYDYHTWLADAARRVSQIQAVTHVLKATHPDARGTSLYAPPQTLPSHTEIGTHLLGENYADDIVGNAAALDVYKFLKLEVEGKRLLDWLQQDDADLLVALHQDETTAKEWAAAFKSLVRSTDELVSHVNAKQVYWCVSGEPVDDAGYHLLQPLFSSSLAHKVHEQINDVRFGEKNKEARQAYFKKQAHDFVYHDYRGLVIRKLGGTKPQNISQLNSERGGVNYLMASLPPRWNQERSRNFLFVDSALDRFRGYEGVNGLIKSLVNFMKTSGGRTVETQVAREKIERLLGESLVAFGLATRQLHEPGWTRNADCRLPLCEQLWLDPERAELPFHPDHEDADKAFQQAFEWKDWPDEVAHRFGNWLNDILKKENFPVGDAEHAHWAKQALIDTEWRAPMQRRALKTIAEEVTHG